MRLKVVNFLQQLIYKFQFFRSRNDLYPETLLVPYTVNHDKSSKANKNCNWVKLVTNISEWENWIMGSMTSFTQKFESLNAANFVC